MTAQPREPGRPARAHEPSPGSSAEGPRILPLPRQLGGAESLRAVLEAIVADVAAEHAALGLPAVRVTLDVPAGQAVEADGNLVRCVLDGLVRAAYAAAVGAVPRSGGPAVREVVVTSVADAEAVEVEVADSGVTATANRPAVSAAQALVGRCGGEVAVHRCPEGGTAVTLRFSLPRSRRQAA